MNVHLENIKKLIEDVVISDEEKQLLLKKVADADKQWAITDFKLDRTEKVKRTTAILLEETIEELEQKRKAVEAQNRELEIETAMERVRSRTMAMQQSTDLADTSALLFQQIRGLGFDTWSCGFCTWQKDDFVEVWMGADSGELLPPMMIPYLQEPTHHDIYTAYQTGVLVHEKVWEGTALDEHYTFLRSIPSVAVAINQLENAGLALPTRQCYYVGFFKQGYLLLITKETNVALAEITKRFAKVFEQTYTRFLDLQKAEAQARESEIELALERIRARTMAMQHSNELADASFLLDTQVRSLGIKTRGCAFNIYGENESTEWFSSEMGTMPTYKTPREKIFLSYYEAGQKGEAFLTKEFSGNECVDWYNYLCTLPVLGDGLKQMIAAGGSFPTRQIDHVSFFKYGYLLFLTFEPVPEFHEIFKRFAKVFEQTYTRFLDLQKAEASAREARIEAALEKVRSRSLGMQKSEELKEVIKIVYQQLTHLNIKIDHAGFVVDYAPRGNWHFWIADEQDIPAKITHPYFPTVWADQFNEAKEKHTDIFATNLNFEEKNKFYNELLSHVSGLPEASKEFYLSCPGLAVSTVLFDSVSLYIENFSGLAYSDEENKILLRFGKVFEQTYTRFLDLQKAETQAREAQIEMALEKVRSKTLAMQKSEELGATTTVLFQQLIYLGIAPNRLYIAIIQDKDGYAEFWITDEEGEKLSTAFHTNLHENVSFKKMLVGWKQEKKSLIVDMQGNELQEYFKYLSNIHVPFKGGIAQKRRLQHVAYFSKGFIGMASPDDQPMETVLLLERFAAVFNLTFTRFNDLKIAETHAMQAELDLIAIKESRQKAEAALEELQTTQMQLIQSAKMASLGELTAGIAHEIQNPLNFVNNFSEVNTELIDELKSELANGNIQEAIELANDISVNETKINHHGKRADAIVKGMLQHSQGSTGKKEPTDINALCDEYLRLSYHGFRAKDKSFNSTMKTDFDASIGNINIIPQDIGRVILNLINNAFYAVNQRRDEMLASHESHTYEPTVFISTKKLNDKVQIIVKDNGNGIHQNIVDKIFQPFFTTKPTGQGTGLGLSLAFDIVTKGHSGELKVETHEKNGSDFIIKLPVQHA